MLRPTSLETLIRPALVKKNTTYPIRLIKLTNTTVNQGLAEMHLGTVIRAVSERATLTTSITRNMKKGKDRSQKKGQRNNQKQKYKKKKRNRNQNLQ